MDVRLSNKKVGQRRKRTIQIAIVPEMALYFAFRYPLIFSSKIYEEQYF